ncbi:type I restriction-modification system subunit M [Chloroflexales bacterium ZM16-3]|nr:type I restriction-modification system subunit M [Chloroflexales bacterium ZM16-3]
MAVKKSEIYSSLWKSCDELRGGMDASQYKDYVLSLLFIKYVSDKYAGQPDAPIVVPEGGSFADMVKLKGKKDIGEGMNKIVGALAEANELRGVINVADFNDGDKLGQGKDMQDKLSALVAIFESPALNFSRNRADGDDLLGDAYEYLMRHFATESGKSKGQFYTPAEVSRVIAKVIGISAETKPSHTIYDPTCGSGSLLLKAADEAPHGITIYGQEMDNATAALARMNMILHSHPTAEIRRGNTLANPLFLRHSALQTFDFAVANPPFSSKAWSSGLDPANDDYERFSDGLVPPTKNGDYAFLLHVLKSLKSAGKGAIILPHGVLFRGNAEAKIRKDIVQRGYIKGIIGLPPNLFYGTGIPACIIVLDKEHAAARGGIFMIDASKGFVKDGPKNRLRHQDVHKIVDVFNRQLELPRYARMVPLAEIAANDYNLNIPRYIDSSDPEDLHDIGAHLLGGIPERDVEALNRYWQVFPSLRQQLFASAPRSYACQLRVDPAQVKPTIFAYPEFVSFTRTIDVLLEQWKAQITPKLTGLSTDSDPKKLIDAISEGLLECFAEASLVDKYDLYQHVMSYWAESMQDDVYLITADAWVEASKLRMLVQQGAAGKGKDEADLKVGKLKYKADLIPPALIIARYFAADQQAIAQLEATRDALSRELEELDEEHGGEGGLLDEARNEKGKLTKASLKARAKEIQGDPDANDERAVVTRYLDLIDQEAEANTKIKAAEETLTQRVMRRYQHLSVDEIKALVVEDKWLATLIGSIQGEIERVSHALAGRVRQLAERYAAPLPQLVEETEALSVRVEMHLEKMGFVWE